jgi:hypothetical protein
MIVWGGSFFDGDSHFLNTGGRYNPSTDSWTATTTTNAPTARQSHTAVSTGSEMIVWGGGDSSNLFNTGGRYDSGTDSWTATSTTSAPDARVGHTAVWTDSEMIVWGGGDSEGEELNTGGRYDLSTDSWTTTNIINAPRGRVGHTAVWTGSEMIVWGGIDGRSEYPKTGGRYCAQAGGPFTLTAAKLKVNGINTVRLIWSGATSTQIDVYRDGNRRPLVRTLNDGAYVDSTGDTGQAHYIYGVCEAGTSTCSNSVGVRFPQ